MKSSEKNFTQFYTKNELCSLASKNIDKYYLSIGGYIYDVTEFLKNVYYFKP